jgi:hypothetical protein
MAAIAMQIRASEANVHNQSALAKGVLKEAEGSFPPSRYKSAQP